MGHDLDLKAEARSGRPEAVVCVALNAALQHPISGRSG
jgi:hypothetical protein